MIVRYHISFKSSFGWIRPVSDGAALIRLDWDQLPWRESDHPDNVSRETMRQLQAYFAGELTSFDLPLNPEGTSDAAKMWLNAMVKIPYGETMSYGDFAALAGKPMAARAAGSACANNPIPIIYPCHRVVRADGRLGSYGGGSQLPPSSPENLQRKADLIALEKNQL